jgi:triosephosphate isomerase (TIM)
MKLPALAFTALISSSSGFVIPLTTPFSLSTTALDVTATKTARKPFISGNWKLNPQTRTEAVQLAADVAASISSSSPDADVALFVPYVFIEAAQEAVGGRLEIGAEVLSASWSVLAVEARRNYLAHISFTSY